MCGGLQLHLHPGGWIRVRVLYPLRRAALSSLGLASWYGNTGSIPCTCRWRLSFDSGFLFNARICCVVSSSRAGFADRSYWRHPAFRARHTFGLDSIDWPGATLHAGIRRSWTWSLHHRL